MAEVQQTKPNSRGRAANEEFNDGPVMQEVVIHVNRVARVVKGGRRFRFQALVAVGDGGSQVGVGVAKAGDVQAAVTKAVAVAKKSLITIPLYHTTIPHDIEAKSAGARIMLKPASPGTGIIAGGTTRAIINLTGIANLLSKSLGSSNKINIAYATIDALKNLVPKDKWMADHRMAVLKNQDAAQKTEVKPKAAPKKDEPSAKLKAAKAPAAKPKSAAKPKVVAKPKAKATAPKKAAQSTKSAAKPKKSTAKKEGDK